MPANQSSVVLMAESKLAGRDDELLAVRAVLACATHPRRHDPTDDTLIDALHQLLMVCWMSGRPALWAPFDASMAHLEPNAPAILVMCRSSFGDPARDTLAALGRYDSVPIQGDDVSRHPLPDTQHDPTLSTVSLT